MPRSLAGPRLVGFSEFARWNGPRPSWSQVGPSGVSIEAPAGSDRFHEPTSDRRQADSPAWLAPVAAPATLVASVRVEFVATFDAGVLMAYQSPSAWAKLCFERAPDGRPTIVSVVTTGRSDDANAYAVDSEAAWLRISVLPEAYAFHASGDGLRWNLIRYFTLGRRGRRRVGLSAQAPTGPGCRATFTEVRLAPGVVADVRAGD